MPNPKGAAWYNGGGVGPALAPGAGVVYYVYGIDAGIGSNANNGLTPDAPFLTLTYALAQATIQAAAVASPAWQTYIVVLDYWQPTGEVWPISVDVNNVHIIGSDGGGTRQPIITPTGDTAGLSIAADRVTISNLCINGGATHGCIENDSTAGAARWGLKVDRCWFAVLGSAQDGIKNVAAGDNVYLEVTRCRFGFAITRDGIRVEHNATRCMIGTPWDDGGNIFDRVQGIAINIVGNAADIGIYDNVIAIPANTAGAGITLSAGTAGSIIAGNQANFGDSDMGNNAYSDLAGAGSNHWMANFIGITLTQPS